MVDSGVGVFQPITESFRARSVMKLQGDERGLGSFPSKSQVMQLVEGISLDNR